uniref:Uncharacterized protein n=1 Tax=Bionectria ochroleuca TaxID=29856 RepID=A0A0B7K729_BIOOC
MDSISESRLRARQVWPTIAARTGHCEKLQSGPLGARITRAFATYRCKIGSGNQYISVEPPFMF